MLLLRRLLFRVASPVSMPVNMPDGDTHYFFCNDSSCNAIVASCNVHRGVFLVRRTQARCDVSCPLSPVQYLAVAGDRFSCVNSSCVRLRGTRCFSCVHTSLNDSFFLLLRRVRVVVVATCNVLASRAQRYVASLPTIPLEASTVSAICAVSCRLDDCPATRCACCNSFF